MNGSQLAGSWIMYHHVPGAAASRVFRYALSSAKQGAPTSWETKSLLHREVKWLSQTCSQGLPSEFLQVPGCPERQTDGRRDSRGPVLRAACPESPCCFSAGRTGKLGWGEEGTHLGQWLRRQVGQASGDSPRYHLSMAGAAGSVLGCERGVCHSGPGCAEWHGLSAHLG